MQDALVKRFLRYVQTPTMSNEESSTFPSSSIQIDFAKQLVDECKQIGLIDVTLDKNGYVMATLPSSIETQAPIIGFIAHMDTVPDYPGEHVNPQLIPHYEGGSIPLNETLGIHLTPEQFPVLNDLVGESLITTDGTTILGADDKAGIAEILTAMEYLVSHPEIPHGKIRIAFTPDEEIGHGVDYFDVARFGADFAYTIDGCDLGELQYENFNAASAVLHFNGISVHPGSAKNKMKNSTAIACEYQSLLPTLEVPENTTDHEGFYHLHAMEGTVENTVLHYIIRDHNRDQFEKRKETLLGLAHVLNKKYGENTIDIQITDSYYNMKEIVEQHPHIIALAKKAFENVGITPILSPIRGGTDGARLSFMGLPCPNIFTGGYNCHGKYEFAVISHMLFATKTIIEICTLNVKSNLF